MGKTAAEIVLVDDEPSARAGLRRVLRAEGFRVRAADDGRAALQLVTDVEPDVVVSDLRMPEMDGLELLQELRARGVDAPVVLVSAVDDVPSVVEAIRSGATDYVTKPVEVDALLDAVRRALRTRQLLREAATLRARTEQLVREAEQHARELRQETERNVRAREELLAILAHDLRGPLSTIQFAAAMPPPRAAPDRRLEQVQRAARRMGTLVDDLLDASRIESGGLRLEVAPHRASALVEAVACTVGPVGERRGVVLETSIAEDFTMQCAFDRIVQALVNLVSNAIRLTEPGRRVRVLADAAGDRATFTVDDEGPGIAPEDLPRIFERGFRGGDQCRGAGLGLTIAKGIVEAHGGRIDVESTLGSGSTFRVEIPLRGPEHTSWRVAAR